MFYKYFDLPALPDWLIVQAISLVTNSTSSKQHRGVYKRYPVSSDILLWCQKNVLPTLENNFKLGVQIFSSTPEYPHTDGNRGSKALNFLIDAGGDNVITQWLQEESYPVTRERGYVANNGGKFLELEQVCLKPNTWHVLQTDVIHTVKNVTRPRIALSIGLEEDEYSSLLTLRNIV